MSGGWDRQAFKRAYVAAGGSAHSANGYVSYLNRAERALGGLSAREARSDGQTLIERAERLPISSWKGERNRRDSLSALRKFVVLSGQQQVETAPQLPDAEPLPHDDVIDLLRQAQALGTRYYRATGKPLGITGEVAEFEAAEKLGLRLCDARTAWYDALDPVTNSRVQIKGRAVDQDDRYRGMCSAIKCSAEFDEVVLVLLDKQTLKSLEIWRTSVAAVVDRIAGLTSDRRRASGTLAITQFKSIANLVWSRW